MKLVDTIQSIPSNAVIAIGMFDGVHRGHQSIFQAALAFAKAHNREAWVVTFDPPPQSFLQPDHPVLKIEPLSAHLFTLFEQGFENIACLPFTQALAVQSPADFASEISGMAVFCGEDWRFGKAAVGTPAFLQARGIEVHVLPNSLYQGERISSTRIRAAIKDGRFFDVSQMLGRPCHYAGVVDHGRGLAAKVLGVPTANIPLAGDIVLPAKGVYHAIATCEEGAYHAMVNFGVAPSIKGLAQPIFEAYLFNFSGDLYDKDMVLSFSENILRSEKKFDNVEALKAQIRCDLGKIKELL